MELCLHYEMLDIDITLPLPFVRVTPDTSGLGVLLRRNGRPVHFFLHELAPGSALQPDDVSRLISSSAGRHVLRETIREALSVVSTATGDVPSGDVPSGDVTPGGISLTAVVCTRGRPELLAACLRALLEQHNTAVELEILVVDNAPPDTRTRDVVTAFPEIRYVCEPRPGLDFARNRALVEASTDFVAYLDDDVEADGGWLDGIVEALVEHPDAGLVTGLVLPYELATGAQIMFERRGGFGRGFQKLRYHGQHLPGNPLYPCGAGIFGAGCNMVVRRDVAVGLGGFDEALDTGPPLPGGGDIDMFYRMIRSGRPLIYEPSALVFHKHRREHGGLRHQYWTWGTGFMAFVSKTYRTDRAARAKLRRLGAWWFTQQLRELRRSIRGTSTSTADLVAAELIGGLVGLAGTYRRSVKRTSHIRERYE